MIDIYFSVSPTRITKREFFPQQNVFPSGIASNGNFPAAERFPKRNCLKQEFPHGRAFSQPELPNGNFPAAGHFPNQNYLKWEFCPRQQNTLS